MGMRQVMRGNYEAEPVEFQAWGQSKWQNEKKNLKRNNKDKSVSLNASLFLSLVNYLQILLLGIDSVYEAKGSDLFEGEGVICKSSESFTVLEFSMLLNI